MELSHIEAREDHSESKIYIYHYPKLVFTVKKMLDILIFHGFTRDIRRKPSYWPIIYWSISDASIRLVRSNPKI